MERRRFLQLVSAGAGALVFPGWLSRALAQDHPDATPASTLTLATLSAEYRAAQRLGKPLLVVVAPEDGSGGELAVAFGALVFAGPPAALADLALAEVVCAKLSDVRALVPQAPRGTPTLILIETDRVPALARGIDVSLDAPLMPPARPRLGQTGRGIGEVAEARFDFQIAALAGAVHGALAPSHDVLVQRAVTARRALDAATVTRLDAALAAAADPHHTQVELDALLVDRGAAVVALATADAPSAAVGTRLRTALAGAARSRLTEHDVPGSVWGTDEGCGPCGMGYVSPRAEHFLHFFAQPGFRSMF